MVACVTHSFLDQMSEEEKKKALEDVRDRVQEKLRERRRQRLRNPCPYPLYDDVYFEGMAWLNSL